MACWCWLKQKLQRIPTERPLEICRKEKEIWFCGKPLKSPHDSVIVKMQLNNVNLIRNEYETRLICLFALSGREEFYRTTNCDPRVRRRDLEIIVMILARNILWSLAMILHKHTHQKKNQNRAALILKIQARVWDMWMDPRPTNEVSEILKTWKEFGCRRENKRYENWIRFSYNWSEEEYICKPNQNFGGSKSFQLPWFDCVCFSISPSFKQEMGKYQP